MSNVVPVNRNTRQIPRLSESRSSPGLWSLALGRLLRNKLALGGVSVILLTAALAALAPLLTSYDPAHQEYTSITQAPGSRHWLGTDQLGRDAFSRLAFGARTSLAVGIFTQIIVVAIGIPLGAIAGYIGSRTDNLIMRFVDIVYAFPDLLFIILLRSVLGPGIMMIFFAIGLVAWTNVARLIRGQVLSVREMDYVTAARAVGATHGRILLRHVMPSAMIPLIVAVTFGIPRAIFVEAALSYIGIGIRPPTPSWGSMIQDGYSVIFVSPYLVLFPAIAIALIMMAFTFLGDGLRDALDPRIGYRHA